MRRSVALAFAALVGLSSAMPALAATVTITCSSVGGEQALCQNAVKQWEAMTGHRVEVYSPPTSAEEQLALYRQMLESGSGDVDVFQIDMIWPGALGRHFIDLRPYLEASDIAAHFDAIIAGLTRDGELLAMPWFTEVPLLYYRADLLEKYGLPVPETWTQMTDAARIIQEGERVAGNGRFWGFVWQGRANEGLTGTALEWVSSHGGGRIVEPDGRVSINNPNAVRAIELAASWIGTISPEDVLNYQDEEARGVFQTGNAAFMRHWPHAYAQANRADSPIAGKFGVAPLPKGAADGPHAAALRGWQLAVSRYSDNPGVAADLVRFLTSYDVQKARAIEGGLAPTYPALYRDPEVLAANPLFERLRVALDGAVVRPSAVAGERYKDVSSAFVHAVHTALSGDGSAAENLAKLEQELTRMSRGGRW